ncbi:MAG: BREX protein BrxB domain-containing protein [Shewanella sp.]
MSDRLSKLLQSYASHISVPWKDNISAEEKAIFVIYDKADELKLRARMAEFEQSSTESGHPWLLLDLTNAFPNWMAEQDYKESYFEDPEYLEGSYGYFADELVAKLSEQINVAQTSDSVVALLGCGTLFGFVSVSALVKSLAVQVQGRLVVFFPGEYHENNYKLLDAKDGWGYQATAITVA